MPFRLIDIFGYVLWWPVPVFPLISCLCLHFLCTPFPLLSLAVIPSLHPCSFCLPLTLVPYLASVLSLLLHSFHIHSSKPFYSLSIFRRCISIITLPPHMPLCLIDSFTCIVSFLFTFSSSHFIPTSTPVYSLRLLFYPFPFLTHYIHSIRPFPVFPYFPILFHLSIPSFHSISPPLSPFTPSPAPITVSSSPDSLLICP